MFYCAKSSIKSWTRPPLEELISVLTIVQHHYYTEYVGGGKFDPKNKKRKKEKKESSFKMCVRGREEDEGGIGNLG